MSLLEMKMGNDQFHSYDPRFFTPYGQVLTPRINANSKQIPLSDAELLQSQRHARIALGARSAYPDDAIAQGSPSYDDMYNRYNRNNLIEIADLIAKSILGPKQRDDFFRDNPSVRGVQK